MRPKFCEHPDGLGLESFLARKHGPRGKLKLVWFLNVPAC